MKIIGDLIVDAEREPDLRREKTRCPSKALRHDADDRKRTAVDPYGRAEQTWVASAFVPVTVTYNRDARAAPGSFLLGQKGATGRRRNTHHRKITRAHQVSECAASTVFLAHTDHGEIVRKHAVEDGILFTDVAVGRV